MIVVYFLNANKILVERISIIIVFIVEYILRSLSILAKNNLTREGIK